MNGLIKGKTVAAVRQATATELDANGFDSDDSAMVVVFTDGTYLMPSRDPEGNGPGIFFINEDKNSFYPQDEA